jgi:hypothetical protein
MTLDAKSDMNAARMKHDPIWRVGFDIGGVLSKYPDFFRAVIASFDAAGIECHVITDMHDRDETLKILEENVISIPPSRVHNSDYDKHGEACKAVVMRECKIDVLFDDFLGYATWPFSDDAPIRFLVMPDARKPYCADSWKAAGAFSRRHYVDVNEKDTN